MTEASENIRERAEDVKPFGAPAREIQGQGASAHVPLVVYWVAGRNAQTAIFGPSGAGGRYSRQGAGAGNAQGARYPEKL